MHVEIEERDDGTEGLVVVSQLSKLAEAATLASAIEELLADDQTSEDPA